MRHPHSDSSASPRQWADSLDDRSWATTFSVDAIILSLTIFRSVQIDRRAGTVPIVRALWRDGLVYYFLITLTHVVSVGNAIRESGPFFSFFFAVHRTFLRGEDSQLTCSLLVLRLDRNWEAFAQSDEHPSKSRLDESYGVSSRSFTPCSSGNSFGHFGKTCVSSIDEAVRTRRGNDQ